MKRQRILQELESLRAELAKVASNGSNLQSESVQKLSARIDELVVEYLRSSSNLNKGTVTWTPSANTSTTEGAT